MPLTIRSRQKSHPADVWLLRRLAKWTLAKTELGQAVEPGAHELGVYLVDPVEMARANWDYLQHDGPTDVITFDYGEPRAFGRLGRPRHCCRGWWCSGEGH